MKKNPSSFDPSFINPTLEQLAQYKILAEQGDPEAQFKLGICYVFGKGCTLNAETAHVWIKLAANSGYIDAINFRKNILKGPIPNTISIVIIILRVSVNSYVT